VENTFRPIQWVNRMCPARRDIPPFRRKFAGMTRHHEMQTARINKEVKNNNEDLWHFETRHTRFNSYRSEKCDGIVENQEQHVQQRDES
jgi:hypothetical protein